MRKNEVKYNNLMGKCVILQSYNRAERYICRTKLFSRTYTFKDLFLLLRIK